MMSDPQTLPAEASKNGMKAYQAGDFQNAIQLFAQAVSGYQASGDALSAAEAANNLSTCYLRSNNPQKALEVIEGTDDVFAAAGDKFRQAIALGNQASSLESLGKPNQAIEIYEHCSTLLKETNHLDERGIVLKSLAALHMKMGHQLDAMSNMQIALLNEKKPSLINRFLKKLLKIPFGS